MFSSTMNGRLLLLRCVMDLPWIRVIPCSKDGHMISRHRVVAVTWAHVCVSVFLLQFFFVLFFPELGSDIRQTVHQKMEYLTLRSVSSLNNPQNSEMNFLWKYEVDMLKIIIIIISYTLNNFTTHIRIS
jgi:hypothetical protein